MFKFDYLFIQGYLHEQNREDRDQHLIVFPENIKEGAEGNFEKREEGNSDYFEEESEEEGSEEKEDEGEVNLQKKKKKQFVNSQRTPFDLYSVLLYPPKLSNRDTVSKNGEYSNR